MISSSYKKKRENDEREQRRGERENLNGDLVDLVENVDARHKHTIALNDVNQIVDGCVKSHSHIRIVDFVFAQNRLDQIQIQMGQ